MDNGVPRSNGKRRLRKILYIYIALMLALIFCSKTIYNFSLPKVTVVMPQARRLNKELEARGVIEFAETIDICADSSGRIDELLIKKGGVVTAGMTVARLAEPEPDGSAVKRINNLLAGLNLSKTDIQNKLKELSADPAELIPYENAADDAQTALGRAQAEYDEAALVFSQGDGGSNNLPALTGAEREWSRRKSELQNAEDELARIEEGEAEIFDGYEYLLAINAAEINLERRQKELEKAEEALKDIQSSQDSFDGYDYEKTVASARSAYQRSQEFFEAARANYYNAEVYFNNIVIGGGDGAALTQARQDMNAALTALQEAEQAMNAAEDAYGAANSDMERALNIFLSDSADTKSQAVKTAEDAVLRSENAVSDAERELETAKEALNRAEAAFNEQQAETRKDELAAAGQKLNGARTAAGDAEYDYNRAVSELQQATANAEKDSIEKLEAAGIILTDAKTALDRAEKNLELAAAKQLKDIEAERKDYNFQLNKLELDIALAEMDLLAEQPPGGNRLTSGYGGVIVSVDKKMGQYVSEGERIAVAGVAAGAFVCEIAVPEEDARFIEIGDAATVRQSGSAERMEAVVSDITLEGDALRLRLALESETLSGGEYVSVTFAKQSAEYETVVPAETVVSTPVSSYVWVLAWEDGAFGVEYYTRKVNVLIADKDGFYTAISAGLDNYLPVVISYDKEPSVNGRVSRMGE